MRYLLIAILLLVLAPLACSKPDPERYKKTAEQACERAWRDSGLRWRLSPTKPYLNDDTVAYICQVEVDGRWVDDDHVKLSPRSER